MVDLDLLNGKVSESGLKLKAIAREMGVSRQTLYHLLNGKSDFSAREIAVLSNMLDLTAEERERIFFAQ